MLKPLPHSVTKCLALALLAGLVFFGATWLISNRAPNSTFTTITGKKFTLAQLRGKPILVTFWASDCPSCLEEIPHLTDLYHRYHGAGLEIIAIAMHYDPPSRVVAMTRAKQIPYDVVLDLSSDHARAFGQVRFTPSTFLIDTEGKFAMKKTGVSDPLDLKARIEKLLKG